MARKKTIIFSCHPLNNGYPKVCQARSYLAVRSRLDESEEIRRIFLAGRKF